MGADSVCIDGPEAVWKHEEEKLVRPGRHESIQEDVCLDDGLTHEDLSVRA